MPRTTAGARAVRFAAVLMIVLGLAAILMRLSGFDLQMRALPVVQQTAGAVFELRSVFGDHVCGAEIRMGDRHKGTTDEFGVASLSGLPVGDVEVTVSAAGYRTITRTVFLSPGKNSVVFGNETGLIPDGFAVDFHVYWNTTSGGMAKGIAEISLYNGKDVPVFLTECDIVYPGEASVLRLLGSEEACADFTGTYSGPDIVSQPEMAIKIGVGQIVHADPVILPGTPRDGEVYSLRVVSASDLSKPRDGRDVLTLTDVMDYDGDWDPHVP